jgi:tripartite ATP-independent transporter DctM subunit
MMAAIVGTSIASAAAFAKIAYRPLVAQGYPKRLSLGLIAGSSVLGPLIPPSLLFLLYGILTNTSVGKLLIAGVIPGLLLTVLYIFGIRVMLWKTPVVKPAVGSAVLAGLKASNRGTFALVGPFVLIMLVMIVGIYAGIFTPTESAAVGGLATFAVAFAARRIGRKDLGPIFEETALTTGAIFILFVGAQLYSRMLTLTGLVDAFGAWLLASNFGSTGSLFILIVVMLGLGCLIDSSSIILLMSPFLLQYSRVFNQDLIWLGVITVVTVEVGLVTPPFGMSAFTVKSAIGNLATLEDVFAGSVPFIFMMLVLIALVILFPPIATWLPAAM